MAVPIPFLKGTFVKRESAGRKTLRHLRGRNTDWSLRLVDEEDCIRFHKGTLSRGELFDNNSGVCMCRIKAVPTLILGGHRLKALESLPSDNLRNI